jgi:hypothetical protein
MGDRIEYNRRNALPLILVMCGFSALVINRISIEYGETNLRVFKRVL